MLVFLDESGDTGRKITTGSSAYFIVCLVIFDDHEEALACDQRIELLRTELAKPNYEFHFSDNSSKVRQAFLAAVNPYRFTYCTVVVNKHPGKLFGEGFNVKSSFYKYASHMVFTNALPYLDKATVVIDKSGSDTFQGELRRYLKNKLGADGEKIKKFKQQDSKKNNLLQLADYCVGVSARKAQNKKDWQLYYKYVAPKELSWQEWPK